MLRRAIQRARLHVPAPIGHDNGAGSSPSDDDEQWWSPSVSYTSLPDDAAARDHFRTLPEDVSGVHLLTIEDPVKVSNQQVKDLTDDEERRAADAWARLQALYGLFKELETTAEDVEALEPQQCEESRPTGASSWTKRQDDGLRSLLQETKLPHGVVRRDLRKLELPSSSNGHMPMPQGFTAGMFESLGNALYNEMLVAAEQNRISPDALQQLGNSLYQDAEILAISAAA